MADLFVSVLADEEAADLTPHDGNDENTADKAEEKQNEKEKTTETTGAVTSDGGSITLPASYFYIGGGILLAVIAVAVVILALVSRRRKKKEESGFSVTVMPTDDMTPTEDMSPEPPAEIPAGSLKVGRVHEQGARSEQQDSFGISDESLVATHGLLAVVCDGMGGLQDGGRVSAGAVQEILNTFVLSRGRVAPKELLATLLRCAVTSVNDMLGEDNLRKSGSTLVMTYINNGYFSFLSVGDSRISLYRGGVLMQLNREHTYQNELLLRAVNSEMSIRDAMTDPMGKGLVSFIGIVDMPASPLKLYPGDKLILMSDGVYNAVSSDEIASSLALPVDEAAESLKECVAAKNYSNQDNYTAVIIGYDG